MKDQIRPEINFRDLGGYPTKDGKTVKYNQFFRSGGLYLMNEKELDVVRSKHLHCILDLRTKQESLASPDPQLEGVTMLRHAGLVSKGGEEIDFSPKGMFQTGLAGQKQLDALTHYYNLMPFQNEAFQVLFKEITDNHTPILFHCATGKDRTGVAAMLILLALNVDEETVFNDYMLSNTYRKEPLTQSLTTHKAEIEQSPVLKELLTMKDGVSANIGQSVLKSIKERYGSYDAYFFHEFGYTTDDLQRLRNMYTES